MAHRAKILAAHSQKSSNCPLCADTCILLLLLLLEAFSKVLEFGVTLRSKHTRPPTADKRWGRGPTGTARFYLKQR
jgi:hypothetical protein